MTNRIREFWQEQEQGRRAGQVRGPREPSLRNRDIYHGVRTQGFTQEELALQFGISQTRVSQIVRQCDRWFAEPQAAGTVVPSSQGRRRLKGYLDGARLETIYILAMRDHQRAEKRQCVSKTGSQDGRIWSETTHRDLPVNSQPLKVALRALELMWKLDQQAEEEGQRGANSVGQDEESASRDEALPPATHGTSGTGELLSAQANGCKCGQLDEVISPEKSAVVSGVGGESS